MLIQKFFHLHQPVHEARSRLATIASYRRQLEGVSKAMIATDGIAHFRFEPGLGYSVNVDLAQVPCSASDCALFRSVGGNVEVTGMIEFFEIQENLTEVSLTIDYELKAPLARIVDGLAGVVDRFFNAQLRRMQAHFEGVGTFTSHYEEPVHRSRELVESAA